MKILNKTIAMLAVASMVVSSTVTAFASFSEITVEQSATKVAAGEEVTITATFDTLVDAAGMEIEFVYDDDSFDIDTTDNTDYNFGTNKKPVYYPNYVIEDVLANYQDEMSIYNAWGMLSYNNYENGVKFLSTDTESGYVIEDGDEAEDMYPYKSVGVIFTAKDGIADGEYTFTVNAKVSDSKKGVIASTKTVTVKVGEDKPAEPVTGSTGVCGKPEAGNAMLNPKTGDEENTVVTSFNEVELTAPSFVVKNGDVTKTFDASYFPTNVKGAATFIAILRYAASAVTSNVFEMELFNGETSLGTATYVAE